jgi:hypothetical protein
LLQAYNDKRTQSRRYLIGNAPSLDDIPAAAELASPHYLLFLAVDAASIDDERLRSLARTLIDRGMAYLCAWGNDCSRVHDQFDLERDPNETDGRAVMTTWHDDEPISEALWFFANVAFPPDDFEADCTDWVAISVANGEWEQEIISELVVRNDGFPP